MREKQKSAMKTLLEELIHGSQKWELRISGQTAKFYAVTITPELAKRLILEINGQTAKFYAVTITPELAKRLILEIIRMPELFRSARNIESSSIRKLGKRR